MTVSKAAQIKITAKTDQAQQELAKLAGAGKKVTDTFEDMGKSGAKASKSMASGVSIGNLQTVAVGLAATAVSMDRVILAGARYQALLQNLPFSIDAARKATDGFIGETALMEGAMRANRAGVASNATEFAKWAKTVQGVAMSAGQDATEAMEVLTKAVANQESELLDNYGVILKVEQAQKILADQLNVTTAELTPLQKSTAFQTIAMQKLDAIAKKSVVGVDEFTAAWMRAKAAMTDLPSLIDSARESTYEFMVASDGVSDAMERELAGVNGLIGDHRRGVGFRGLADAVREANNAAVVAKESGKGGTIGAMTDYIDREVKKSEAIIKITSEKLTSGLESAAEERIFGRKSKHKKHAEEIILIYDNAFEEFSNRQRLLAMESNAQIEQALSSRTGTGSLTSDPFARDPKADVLAAQELAAAQRQIQIDAAHAKEDDLAGELDRINREQAAQLDFYTFQERVASSELEMMEAKESKRQAMHDAQLGRIAVEIKAEDKRRQRMAQIGGAVASVHADVAAAAIRGAIQSGQSSREAVKHFAKAKAEEMLILGVSEQIQAIACFAMLNIPQGIAHQTAAGLAFGQAAIFGATYGVLGAGGGGGSKSLPASPGGGSGLTGGGGEKNETSIPQGTPISRPSSSAPPPPPIRMSGGKTTQINVTNYSVLPPDTTQQMLQLRRMLAKSEQEDGAV